MVGSTAQLKSLPLSSVHVGASPRGWCGLERGVVEGVRAYALCSGRGD